MQRAALLLVALVVALAAVRTEAARNARIPDASAFRSHRSKGDSLNSGGPTRESSQRQPSDPFAAAEQLRKHERKLETLKARGAKQSELIIQANVVAQLQAQVESQQQHDARAVEVIEIREKVEVQPVQSEGKVEAVVDAQKQPMSNSLLLHPDLAKSDDTPKRVERKRRPNSEQQKPTHANIKVIDVQLDNIQPHGHIEHIEDTLIILDESSVGPTTRVSKPEIISATALTLQSSPSSIVALRPDEKYPFSHTTLVTASAGFTFMVLALAWSHHRRSSRQHTPLPQPIVEKVPIGIENCVLKSLFPEPAFVIGVGQA